MGTVVATALCFDVVTLVSVRSVGTKLQGSGGRGVGGGGRVGWVDYKGL